MKVTNKIHRGTSLAAAIIMLLMLFFATITKALTLFATHSAYENAEYIRQIANFLISAFTSILLIVVLFRGKKDAFSGAVFIISALPLVFGMFSNMSFAFMQLVVQSVPANMAASLTGSAFIQVFANLVSIIFRVLLAVECFKPGNISRGKMKALLLVLPIVAIIANALAMAVQSLHLLTDYDFVDYLSIAMLPAIFSAIGSIPTVIMGLSLSIPVYQKPAYDYMYGAQQNYDYTCNN